MDESPSDPLRPDGPQQQLEEEWVKATDADDRYLEGLSPSTANLVRRISAVGIDADSDDPSALQVDRARNGRMQCTLRELADGYNTGRRDTFDATFQQVLAQAGSDATCTLDIDGLSVAEAVELLSAPEFWPTVSRLFDPCGTEPMYLNGDPFVTDGRGFIPFDEDEDDRSPRPPQMARTYLATNLLIKHQGALTPARDSSLVQLGVVHVITAWNPPEETRSQPENWDANEQLKQELVSRGLVPIPARGCDPESDYFEDSWAVVGLADAEAIEIGAMFNQEAIFRLTPTTQTVLACNGDWFVSRST